MTQTIERRHVTPYLAAAWCVVYAGLGGWWALRGNGFPFGAGDPHGAEMGSWLSAAAPVPTGIAFVLGAGTALAAIVALRFTPPGRRRVVLAGALLVPAVALLLIVPDVRILQNITYSLRGYVRLIGWPVINQAVCAFGGFLLIRTAFLALRKEPCAACGRTRHEAESTARWARIGRWATIVAALAPLPYAAQRGAWNLGIPWGVDKTYVVELAADLEAKGLHPLTAYMLVVPAVVGSLLTLGLIMRWGERFPRWVPLLGGRAVPVLMAVVPASVIAFAVTVAGIDILHFVVDKGHVSGTAWPGLFWLPWGLALGLATYAYARRRRPGCAGC